MTERINLDDVILEPDFDMTAPVNLVEASAGTGKTYCLQTLYLRMLIERGERIESLLVVTFTEAATKELRDRLRRILYKCRRHLDGELPDDDGDHERIAKICGFDMVGAKRFPEDDARERRFRARRALLEFDRAAVFTIHGFCNRVLRRFAFECRHDFSAELVERQTDLIEILCEDWWRRELYGDPPTPFGVAALSVFEELGKFKDVCVKYAAKPDAVLVGGGDSAEAVADQCEALFQGVLDAWNEDQVRARLDAAKVSRSEKNFKQEVVDAFADGMNELKRSGAAGPLPDNFERFTNSYFAQKDVLLKGSPGAPEHPFLDACEAMIRFRPAVAADAVITVHTEFLKRKRASHRISYDDLLFDLRAALRADSDGTLLAALRAEFQVGLIDEFQDTDPVQYEIFRTLFIDSPDHQVFMVGDPKQAIYSFRNGDIFTYYAAVETVKALGGRLYQLDKNYRSEENLVAAVNRLFGDNPDRGPTFGHEAIRYPGDLRAAGKSADKSLLVNGQLDPNPMKIWDHPPRKVVIHFVAAAVAADVVELLNDDRGAIAGRRPKPSDVAILVNKHSEAAEIHAELLKRGVPAVRQNTGKIFQTREASSMLLILKALCEPTRVRTVKTALATSIMPPTDAELMAAEDDVGIEPKEPAMDDVPRSIGEWMACFQEAKRCWERGSFVRAMTYLLNRTGTVARLLGTRDGERRLTNVLQLVDLIHHAALENHFGLEQARLWLKRRIDGIDVESDEYENRLESDDDAVKIITVFKSKGLEFPVVFVPTLYDRNAEPRKSASLYAYHAEGGEDKTVPAPLILDVLRSPEGKARAAKEILQEDMRLVYVALTRAVHQCRAIAFPKKKPTAIARLVPDERAVGSGVEFPPDLPSVITIVKYGSSAAAPPDLISPDEIPLVRVDKSRGHASFTALSPGHGAAAGELYDYDAAPDSDAGPDNLDEKRDLDIFSFPGGVKTGNCWHAIFERLDFTAFSERAEPEARLKARRLIDDQLELYKIHQLGNPDDDARLRELVHEMVRTTLTTPLDEDGAIRLNEIDDDDKIAEMEFNFPLADAPATMGDVHDVLEKHWRGDPAKAAFLRNPRKLQRNKPIPAGFMTGFMDLVFRLDGKYHILDWKSNRRDGVRGSFDQAGLTEEMADNFYFLQYLLYAVALRRHLKETIPDFSYDRHFGGVFYVFSRGVEAGNPGSGVHADRPEESLVADLSALLEGGP